MASAKRFKNSPLGASSKPTVLQVLPAPHQQLNLKDHCIFCLRQQQPSVISQITVENLKKVENFQTLLNYVTGKDPDKVEVNEVLKLRSSFGVGTLPPMCEGCYNEVGILIGLHQELQKVFCSIQKQVDSLRGKVIEANEKKWAVRGELLSARHIFDGFILTKSGLPVSEGIMACDFVNKLHDPVIAEGQNQVIFPSKLPQMLPPTCPISSTTSVPASTNIFRPSPSMLKKSETVAVPPAAEDMFDDEEEFEEVKSECVEENTISGDDPLHDADSDKEEEDFKDSEFYENDKSNDEYDVAMEEILNPRIECRKSRRKQVFITIPPSTSSSSPANKSEIQLKSRQTNPNVEKSQKHGGILASEFVCEADGCEKSFLLLSSLRAHNLSAHSKGKKVFKCEQCGKKFWASSLLKNHQNKAHSEDKRVQKCDLCLEKIPCVNIEQHMRLHVKDYAIRCIYPKCPLWFSCIYKMEEHVRININNKSITHKSQILPENQRKKICPICKLQFDNPTAFRNHLEEHSNGLNDNDKPYECPIPHCTQRFLLRESVEGHINYHRDLRPLKTEQECKLCQETLATDKMEQHLKESHQVSEPLPCKHCKFLFADRLTLLNHIFEHRDEKGISCDICVDKDEIKYYRKMDLRQHYVAVHKVDIENKFVCEHCPMECANFLGLRSHQSLVHPELFQGMRKQYRRKSTFPCDVCSAIFSGKGKCVDHKIEIHGAPPLQCKLCKDSFLKWNLYRQHQRKHRGHFWKCEVEGCEKVFEKFGSLRSHKLSTHSGVERPFKCDKCEKAYWTSSALRIHQNTAHLGKREICDECGESFASANTLRKHKLIHTGERPYSCHICGQAFRHREVMATHIKSHETKGDSFKPNGPMKQIRKRLDRSN